MGVIWNRPIFKGQTGGVSSVLITLDGEQVGKNKIAADGSFHKGQKTPLPDGTYDLAVWDCGPIAIEPNVGTCTMDGQDLNDYAVLFERTIRVIHEAVRQQQESGSEEPQTATQTVQEPETVQEVQTETPTKTEPQAESYGITVTNANDAPFALGDKIHFELTAPSCASAFYGSTYVYLHSADFRNLALYRDTCNYYGPNGGAMSDDTQKSLMERLRQENPPGYNIKMASNVTVSDDHSKIRGYVTVTEELVDSYVHFTYEVRRDHRGSLSSIVSTDGN